MKRLAVLVAALALGVSTAAAPWALSFRAQGSTLDRDELPFYSHADLRPRWDMWSRSRDVGAFALVDQRGRAIDQRVFADGPTIVSFFYSACFGQCPLSVELLRRIPGNPRILLISDSPLFDTVSRLSTYSKALALPANWRLATGRPDRVFAFASNGLFTDVAARGADGQPRHAETHYLIDRAGRLRGIYDATSPADVLRLQDDRRRLLNEV